MSSRIPKRKSRSDKFSLTLHPTWQYCKKIRVKVHYFGADKKEALTKYLEQAKLLHSGQVLPQSSSAGIDIKTLCNLYLEYQEIRVIVLNGMNRVNMVGRIIDNDNSRISGSRDTLLNRGRQGIAISCGLARNEKDEKVNSDWRTDRRDYSRHCEDVGNVRSCPQGREWDFVRVGNIMICGGGEKTVLQYFYNM